MLLVLIKKPQQLTSNVTLSVVAIAGEIVFLSLMCKPVAHTHTMYGFGQRGRESVSFSVDRLVLRFTGWSYGCGELDVFRCATTSGDNDRRTVLFNSSRHTNSDRPRISTHTRGCALVMGRPVCSSTFWALSFAVNTRSGRHTSTQPRHLRVLATESDSELFLCQLRL